MVMKHEDGFWFHELPSLSGQTKHLIIILHGNRSHPDGYLNWAEETRKANPDADVLVIRGPVAMRVPDKVKAAWRVPNIDDLYTWYDIDSHPKHQAGLVLRQAFNRLTVAKDLNKFINRRLAERSLKDESLAFMGFSMGGIIALQAAYHRKKECAAVVCHSGALFPFTRIKKKPPTLLLMGDRDNIFYTTGKKKMPKGASRLIKIFNRLGGGINLHHDRTLKKIRKAKIDVTEQIFPGQNHVITSESWDAANEFVAKRLRK